MFVYSSAKCFYLNAVLEIKQILTQIRFTKVVGVVVTAISNFELTLIKSAKS
jgi:hypothetical protein